jgi:hypothetical protein
MKKIISFIKFFILTNVLTVCALLVVYTMTSLVYFYFILKLDPRGYFTWWLAHIMSFNFMQYKWYIIVFEIIMLIISVVTIAKEK